jgi:hypothetical protein
VGSSDVLDEEIGELGSVEWEAVGEGVVLSGGVGGPVGEGVSVGWGVGPIVWEVGLCAGGRGGGPWVCGVGVWASGDVGCGVEVG